MVQIAVGAKAWVGVIVTPKRLNKPNVAVIDNSEIVITIKTPLKVLSNMARSILITNKVAAEIILKSDFMAFVIAALDDTDPLNAISWSLFLSMYLLRITCTDE